MRTRNRIRRAMTINHPTFPHPPLSGTLLPPMPDVPDFLVVPHLLESSHHRQRPAWVWYALVGFAIALLTSTLASSQNPALQMYVRALGGFAMLGVVIAMGLFTNYTVRQTRKEQQRVEAIEELVQLRRWDQAAAMLD